MADLVLALERLGPRQVRLLLRTALDGVGLRDLAAEYGVAEASLTTHLVRAARALTAALEGARDEPLPDALEAAEVAAFLSGRGPEHAALTRLGAESEAVRRGRAALAAGQASSPRRQVENWVRWLAILGILGLWLLSSAGAPTP
jgi:hypothetical protein